MQSTDAPIFILGANRSGTTLLRLMLNAHSRIAVPEELLYFRSMYAGVPIESWRSPSLSNTEYRDIVREFVNRAASLHTELDAEELLTEILSSDPIDLRRPYATVLNRWSAEQGKARWGEKTPGNLFYVDVIADMFPDAQFVYLARDPRAGVASMQRANFFPGDHVINALSRRKHFATARSLKARSIPDDQWLDIRYEDLVRAPSDTLRTVCTFLGEEFERDMLQFHQAASSYMKDEAATGFNSAATQPVSTKRIDAWRDQLASDRIAMIETICSEEMSVFDYTPSAHRLSLLHHIERIGKTLYWNWQMWRHRDNRHYTVKTALFARSRFRLRKHISRLAFWTST